MASFEIWIEGYSATGESEPGYRVVREGETDTLWDGVTFQQACVKALNELNWNILYEGIQGLGSSYYDMIKNSYWGRHFYDNEVDARKNFG